MDDTPVSDPRIAKLKEIRGRKDLKLRSTKHLKTTFTDFAGKERPLTIRYYQVQGILHLRIMKRFLLGDDTGLGKCKTLDSLVLTDRGLIPLGDMAPQDQVLKADTFHPLDSPTWVWTGWKWARVRQYYCGGTKPIKRIVTNRGYETTGSLVHPVWIRRPEGEMFIPLQDVRVGDYACLDRSPCDDLLGKGFPIAEPVIPVPDPKGFPPHANIYSVPDRLTPDLARLLGYIVAEGWTTDQYHIVITQHRAINPETHDDIRDLCRRVLGWVGGNTQDKDTTINLSSVYLRTYLEGLRVGFGLSDTKSVPWPIFQGTRESVRAFLQAFFDSECSVCGDVLEISSASERMMREIQTLLLRFGIMASRNSKQVKAYPDKTYWRLSICGDEARTFGKVIGLITPREKESLDNLASKKSNANLDVVPHALELVEALRKEILARSTKTGANGNRKGSGIKQFGVSFEKTLNNIRNGGRNPTYAFLQRMLEVAIHVGASDTDAYKEVHHICKSHFFYDQIKGIHDGLEPVADIEVDDPSHSFVADGFINHNTLQSIAALCYIWETEPDRKVIVLTTKSATRQWVDEFTKFTIGVKVFICKGNPAQRRAARKQFLDATGPTVVVMGYRSAVGDFTEMQGWKGHILITDEATAYKNPKTQVHQVCRHLGEQADRVWALTATMIKNHLMEGFGIYQVIIPGLFGMTERQFMLYYALTQKQQIGVGRYIDVIVGYLPARIREFRQVIDPYFIGRPKHEVAMELPPLTSRTMEVELTDDQETKYDEALEGLLEMVKDGATTVQEVTKLTAISYCQEIIGHLGMIGIEDSESPKVDALIEMVTEGDFAKDKVIAFSRFEKMVSFVMARLKKEKIPAVRVTGKEAEDQRQAAMKAFQDPNSDVRVICVTTAGSEAINLQAAKATICMDTPWSAGEFLQLLGRMIRIGSEHDKCYVIHMVGRRSGKKKETIDHRIMEVLSKKMNLIEAVLGKRIKGEGEDVTIQVENDISDLFSSLRNDAKGA